MAPFAHSGWPIEGTLRWTLYVALLCAFAVSAARKSKARVIGFRIIQVDCGGILVRLSGL